MRNIFWDSREHRPRTLWRLVLQIILFLILTLAFGTFAGFIGGAIIVGGGEMSSAELTDAFASGAIISHPLLSTLITGATLIAVLASLWLAGHFLDRRRFADFGLHLNQNWWIDLAFGLALGAVLMSLIFVVEWAAGWITISDTLRTASPERPFALAILSPLLGFLAVGIYEELLFRGYFLKNMAEGLRPAGAAGAILLSLFISSAVFGIAHAPNPNASVVSSFNIFLAGIFLALGFILTGELAIPIGLHITWNFFQGNVFGFPVSGTTHSATFIAVQQGGDPLLTGGAFGPEAGLIGVGAIVLGSLLTVAWIRLRYGRVGLYQSLATPDLRPQKQSE
jgi:membrane protease YdiL (CAAX protease family)